MRPLLSVLCLGFVLCAAGAYAASKPATDNAADTAPPNGPGAGHIEVTADQSLEWYQDARIYVARGNAKAVRGDMTVYGDLLTAHERDEAPKNGATKPDGKMAANAPPDTAPQPPNPPVSPPSTSASKTKSNDNGTGDIDKMTAEGNVRVVTSKSTITGQHGVYDLDKHVAYVTGDNLKYQTAEDVVTAKDSLEYWEDKKIAVARGNAVGIRGDRHVEGDVLTAQFRDMPNGKSQLHTMTAEGHVVVITTNDVSRADHGVYDINRNIAILTGNVRITKADGTQLTGDVGEVDFAANQSRLLNQGSGRVRALLASKSGPKQGATKKDGTTATATASP
jgi:lipopolysaccharide export system protein LptA